MALEGVFLSRKETYVEATRLKVKLSIGFFWDHPIISILEEKNLVDIDLSDKFY